MSKFCQDLRKKDKSCLPLVENDWCSPYELRECLPCLTSPISYFLVDRFPFSLAAQTAFFLPPHKRKKAVWAARLVSIRSMAEQIFSKLFDIRYDCWPDRRADGRTASAGVRKHSPIAFAGIQSQKNILLY